MREVSRRILSKKAWWIRLAAPSGALVVLTAVIVATGLLVNFLVRLTAARTAFGLPTDVYDHETRWRLQDDSEPSVWSGRVTSPAQAAARQRLIVSFFAVAAWSFLGWLVVGGLVQWLSDGMYGPVVGPAAQAALAFGILWLLGLADTAIAGRQVPPLVAISRFAGSGLALLLLLVMPQP